jgi:hypothetical protein
MDNLQDLLGGFYNHSYKKHKKAVNEYTFVSKPNHCIVYNQGCRVVTLPERLKATTLL